MTDHGGQNGQSPDAPRELTELQAAMKQLRKESGLSLRQLGKKANFSATALNRAEKAPKRPTWDVVKGYVQGCDGPLEEFRRLWEAAGVTAIDDPLHPDDPDPENDPGTASSSSGSLRQLAWLFGVIAVLAVVLLLAAWLFPPTQHESCAAPTVSRETAPGVTQCVGPVTGATSIPPEYGMSSVLGGITAQNDLIGTQPAVSLVYVLPLPAAPSSFSAQLRNELDGVRLAQQRANTRSDVGGPVPQIRILVYNTGQDNAVRSDVLSAIDAPNSDIVAVLGLGQSKPQTVSLIDELSKRLIAMFPARATADKLTSGATGLGLFRIAPPNSELVRAAVTELPFGSRVALLEDSSMDPYNTGLAASFRTALGQDRRDARLIPLPAYDSAKNETGSAFNNEIVPSLCQTDADSVYVAGRGKDIEQFLIALDSEIECTNRPPITVLTGDDGVDVLNQLRRANAGLADQNYREDMLNGELRDAFRNGRFVFRYTALTHPGLWTTDEFRGSREFNDALRSFDSQRNQDGGSDDPGLQEGSAIMGYDSTVAAIRCVRLAASRNDLVAQPSGVIGACYTFTKEKPIFGAGGRIWFDSEGLAEGRPIPMVEVRADGNAPIVRSSSSG